MQSDLVFRLNAEWLSQAIEMQTSPPPPPKKKKQHTECMQQRVVKPLALRVTQSPRCVQVVTWRYRTTSYRFSGNARAVWNSCFCFLTRRCLYFFFFSFSCCGKENYGITCCIFFLSVLFGGRRKTSEHHVTSTETKTKVSFAANNALCWILPRIFTSLNEEAQETCLKSVEDYYSRRNTEDLSALHFRWSQDTYKHTNKTKWHRRPLGTNKYTTSTDDLCF